jgi:hypothetical protein
MYSQISGAMICCRQRISSRSDRDLCARSLKTFNTLGRKDPRAAPPPAREIETRGRPTTSPGDLAQDEARAKFTIGKRGWD